MADIPVHVAQKRTRARSPGSNPAHQSMLNVPGPIAEFGVITQGHWGTSREKPITIVFCTCSFSGRFCIFFAKGRSGESLLLLTSPPPPGADSLPVGRGAACSHEAPGAERWREQQQRNADTVVPRSSPSCSSVCACVSLIFTTNGSFAHGVTPSLLYVPWEDGRASGNRTTFPQPSRGIPPGPRPPLSVLRGATCAVCSC